MSENLGNSAVVTGPEKVSLHSNPKERQCQRMLKLPHNCTHLTCQQSIAQNSRKTSTSASLTTSKLLTVWITTNCGKFFKRWKYQNTLPASLEIWMQVKKEQLEPDMEQHTDFKLGKEYIKAVYCLLVILLLCRVNHAKCQADEAQTGIKIAGRNINNLRYADDTTLIAESEELKSLLMKVKEEIEKTGLKFNIQKTKIMASGPITLWQIYGGKWKQ